MPVAGLTWKSRLCLKVDVAKIVIVKKGLLAVKLSAKISTIQGQRLSLSSVRSNDYFSSEALCNAYAMEDSESDYGVAFGRI